MIFMHACHIDMINPIEFKSHLLFVLKDINQIYIPLFLNCNVVKPLLILLVQLA